MSVSTISRSAKHFYLNYHYVESPSLHLHSAFTRRLQFALRMTVTFLICAFIAYITPLHDKLVHVYMIPNIGVLTIQETFGATLSNNLQITSIIVPLSIILFIAQKIGLSHHHYAVGAILMLITSFLVSCTCLKLQRRKICLWFIVLFFATIINEQTIQPTFPFKLLATFLLGLGVPLIVSLLIFPLFATFDIENRVKYCLLHLDQMQNCVFQAFLSEDTAAAKVSLARASIVERKLYATMVYMQMRLAEAQHEPSRILQKIFNRKCRHLMDLTIQEEEDLISSLMFHVCSLQSMVKGCQFNKYHNDLVDELESKFTEFTSNQSMLVQALTATRPITTEDFTDRLTCLQRAIDSLNFAYQEVRLRRIEEAFQSGMKIQSEDHLSHAFFFFQLGAIVRLLTQKERINSSRMICEVSKSKEWLKNFFRWKIERSRLLSATKSVLAVGIGSIFVMVPHLAKTFANGQWILIALCMTQGDTVGGAFTTMKMRLIGTLFGSTWTYIIYLAVKGNIYGIFGMLVPWILLFGYLKLLPDWEYTATVAASTPILINLGRLYATDLANTDYVLLRIEENVIGIGLGIVLTMLIFPIFASNLLKVNIQDTLKMCRSAAETMHLVYDQIFEHEHLDDLSINIDREEKLENLFLVQHSRFQQLISAQRMLLNHSSNEPSLWWFNNGFSSSRYNTLMQQQLDIFRMLHSINAALIDIHEHSMNNKKHIKDLRLKAAQGLFLPDLHSELAKFNQQLYNCVDTWSSYFDLTQTTYYQWSHIRLKHRNNLINEDLSKNRRCLIELHRIVVDLQCEHQKAMDSALDYYFSQLAEGKELSSFVPFVNNDRAESIFVNISAMYYSTVQLAQAALALGTTIHTVFELETTSVYQDF